jgi:hypothetical protein
VVRVLYDDEALLVAAELADDGAVTSRLGRRDTDLESDWFRLYLDPHHDRRTGVGFWVNPANVQVDMALYNDTWDDWDWDAVWSSATQVGETGWSVEMRIPYSQLRFPDRPEHTWGIDFARRIQRRNEEARLVFVPKTEMGFVSRFAELDGIAGIDPPRSVELLPYAVSRLDHRETIAADDPLTARSELAATGGLDVKVGLTTNLTLTGTLNPDFGQVELDPAELNLTQFELFYPEKRPFFIEGASSFEFGRGGSNHNFGFNYLRPSLFYTRRIGRAPQGAVAGDFVASPAETTILGAAKLTGRTAGGWTLGVLDAVTDEETASFRGDGGGGRVVVEPLTNYLVSRVAREIGPTARVGALFTAVHRDLPAELPGLRSAAYAGGADGHRFFGDRDVLWEWFVGGSRIEGSREAVALAQRSPGHGYDRPDAGHVELDPRRTSLSGWAAGTMVAKQTGVWRYNLQVESYSPGFEVNDVGFMTRADIVTSHAVVLYDDREPGERTRSRHFWVGKYQNWNHDGDLLANGVYGNWTVVLPGYSSAYGWAGANTERSDDRLTRGGPVADVPSGWSAGVGFETDSRRRLVGDLTYEASFNSLGGYYHGTGVELVYKPTSSLRLSVNPSFARSKGILQYVTAVADPAATATYGQRYVFAEIEQRELELGTRLEWTFTPRLSLQVYVQPFVATGDYHGFKELARPRSLDHAVYGDDRGTISFDDATARYTVDPDGGGPAGAFSFADPDFNLRSLRGNAVLRWELRPGSALYAVWNENRAEVLPTGSFRAGRDVSGLADAPSDDVFLVKLSYWLGR